MMRIVVLMVVLLSVFSVGFIQGKINAGEEPVNGRVKRHYGTGNHGSRPTYGGYQTVGGYQQQQQQQPNSANQGQGPRPQSAHGGEYTSYQQPNNYQGFGNMRSSGYYQQPGQNIYPYQPSYQYMQDHHGGMRYRYQ